MTIRKIQVLMLKCAKILFLAVTIYSSFIGFWNLWEENASSWPIRSISPLNSQVGEIITVVYDQTTTIKNYLPQTIFFKFGLGGEELYYNPDTGGFQNIGSRSFRHQEDVEEYLSFEYRPRPKIAYWVDQVQIEEVNIKHFYGSEVLRKWMNPTVYVKPDDVWFFEVIGPFSEVVIDFKWTEVYNITSRQHVTSPGSYSRIVDDKYDFSYVSPIHIFGLGMWSRIINSFNIPQFLWPIFPIISFCLFGYAYANVNSNKIEQLSTSFSEINKLHKKVLCDDMSSEIKETLTVLAYKRHTFLGFTSEIFIGPAFSLFLIFIRKKVNVLFYRCKLEALEIANIFQDFLDDSATSVGKFIFDIKSLTLIFGFITSLGISLAWNIGAISPILLPSGILYLCFNLGFLAYLTRRSTKDLGMVFLLIFNVVIIMIIPAFLDWFRNYLNQLSYRIYGGL